MSRSIRYRVVQEAPQQANVDTIVATEYRCQITFVVEFSFRSIHNLSC